MDILAQILLVFLNNNATYYYRLNKEAGKCITLTNVVDVINKRSLVGPPPLPLGPSAEMRMSSVESVKVQTKVRDAKSQKGRERSTIGDTMW